METKQYTISEAAKKLHVGSHVLRFWEEELHLNIPRNEMGHRVYSEKEMRLVIVYGSSAVFQPISAGCRTGTALCTFSLMYLQVLQVE